MDPVLCGNNFVLVFFVMTHLDPVLITEGTFFFFKRFSHQPYLFFLLRQMLHVHDPQRQLDRLKSCFLEAFFPSFPVMLVHVVSTRPFASP